MRHLVAVVCLLGCGPRSRDERSLPLEMYRAKDGKVLAFSATGKTLIVAGPASPPPYMNQPADLAFVERSTGRVIASMKGFAVGQPSDAEAYALIDQRLVAMVSKREAKLDVPAPAARYHWRLVWSTVDHEAGTALLAFDQDAEVGVGLGENDADRDSAASRFELFDVDVRAMSLRGHVTISHLGSRMSADEVARAIVAVETENGTKQRTYGNVARGCSFAASGARLFLTCRKPEPRDDKLEHWIATRYDGRTIAWSVELETPPDIGGGDIEAAVSGDGKTLVIAHGDRSYGLLDAKTTLLVDTANGNARSIARTRNDLGDVGEVMPVPGTSFVAQFHRYEPHAHSGGSRSFHGISLLDASTGAIRPVLDTASRRELRDAIPDAIVILANGTYLLAI